MIHFDPPSHIAGRGDGYRACNPNVPIGWEREHGASGDTNVVDCPKCKLTEAFKIAHEEQNPMILGESRMHFHGAHEGSRRWACGITNGPATGVTRLVDCNECKQTAEYKTAHDAQEEPSGTDHGDAETVPLHPTELHGEGQGKV
jgi:hypothetical protein